MDGRNSVNQLQSDSHTLPQVLGRTRRAKRSKQEHGSDNTSIKSEDGANHEAARRPINKRKTINMGDFPLLSSMFERNRSFIDKPNGVSTTKREDPEPVFTAIDYPMGANPATARRGRGRAGISETKANRQTIASRPQPELTTPTAQRAAKRARKTTASDADNSAQNGPVLGRSDQSPRAHGRSPVSTTSNIDHPTVTTNERKIAIPTRVSERLKKKAASGKI